MSYEDDDAQEVQLNEGEEIIGIFGGRCDYERCFNNLGFIVWTPVYDIETSSGHRQP